jgi:hypothetical protein
MRSAASRRGLALLALKHLSTTISPATVESETVVAANPGGSAVAAANPDEGTQP